MSRWLRFSLTALAGLLAACQAAEDNPLSAEVIDPALMATSGQNGSGKTVQPPGTGQEVPDTLIETKADASHFLRMAGLGGTDETITELSGTNAVNWVESQLAMPPVGYRNVLGSRVIEDDAKSFQVSQLIYETMAGTDAELRTRMTFALSQLFVVNDSDFFNEGYGLAVWMDTLDHNAFGNYRDLMGDVTRSPIMGAFLTYLYNWKGDPETGQEPDENYARELLQLFTIGLHELNLDGTVRLDGNGQPIPTYDNDDIVGLARVFTGYALAGTSLRWRDRYPDTWERPMMMYDEFHEDREKRFLGTVIAENMQGETSIDLALDAIFAHPNLAPFVSRQLIQRFTASDPTPDYVQRVAEAFESGYFTSDTGVRVGTGQRGDLGATAAAIVLDPSVMDRHNALRDGKVREPVLNFVQFVRAFGQAPTTVLEPDWNSLADTSSIADSLGQTPLRSPSVFNFYRPGYIAPGTETGAANLTAPELQIVNEGSAVGYINFMFDFIAKESDHWDPILVPDLSDEIALANDAQALVDRLDLILTSGRLRPETRTAIVEAVNALPIRDNNADQDRRSRVNIALMMMVVSAEYMSLN